MQSKPILRPRHSASQSAESSDESAFLWAVSYSDMLMVLVAFFVIYYNTDKLHAPAPAEDSLKKIALEVAKTGAKIEHETPKTVDVPEAEHALLKRIADDLDPKSFEWTEAQNHKTLTVYMPDNAYDVGSYELRNAYRGKFIRIINLIRKIQLESKGHILVSLTGHNDDIPLSIRNGTPIISSNAILAGLRATKAADLAVFLGLDKNYVVAESQQESARSTRSLTIRLREIQ